VLDYAGGPTAEWVEFERPTEQELLMQLQQQQQQQQGMVRGDGGCSSSSRSLCGMVMVPVLWFR